MTSGTRRSLKQVTNLTYAIAQTFMYYNLNDSAPLIEYVIKLRPMLWNKMWLFGWDYFYGNTVSIFYVQFVV